MSDDKHVCDVVPRFIQIHLEPDSDALGVYRVGTRLYVGLEFPFLGLVLL